MTSKVGKNDGDISELIYERQHSPFGKSWEEWVALWWQWCSAEPDDSSPVADTTGELCGKNQTQPHVWFLAGTFGGKAERTCTIPANKSIFFPIINDRISYAEHNFLANEADLRSYAKSDLDKTSTYTALIDGKELKNYRVQSKLFDFNMSLDESNDHRMCHSQGISDGYWVFLRPLSVGRHIIHFIGEKLKFDEMQNSNEKEEKFRVEVIYCLTVK